MSIIGPRPQLVRDMVFMDKEQRKRHSAKPGLSGLAQVNGRNSISWEEKIEWDLKYVESISFFEDIKVVFFTVLKAFVKKEGITQGNMATAEDYGDYLFRKKQVSKEEYYKKQILAKKILNEEDGISREKDLADEAIYLERVLCSEAGGWQDQIAASFGGFNRINFGPDGYEVLPLIISPERKKRLNDNLMMFFTGFTRFSSEIQKVNEVDGTLNKRKMLGKIYELVNIAERILTNEEKNLDEFGKLLDLTWKLKRKTGNYVSTDSIDYLYEKGIQAGALGGKLLGAGGGGFLVFYVPPEKQEKVMEAMKELLYIPFKFENGGTRVIHYTPELYTPLVNR